MNTTDKAEKVLCVRRDALPPPWVKDTAVVKMPAEQFLEALEDVCFHWLPRVVAEVNPAYKQFIPYVVIQTADGLHTGCYRRNGAEARLHDFWSVGIGGHINPCDGKTGDGSLGAIIGNGMERETREEFRLLSGETDTVFHGVINEEVTAVGHVHLGLVYRMLVWKRDEIAPGDELDSFGWFRTDILFRKPLELWSRLAVNLLDREWE